MYTAVVTLKVAHTYCSYQMLARGRHSGCLPHAILKTWCRTHPAGSTVAGCPDPTGPLPAPAALLSRSTGSLPPPRQFAATLLLQGGLTALQTATPSLDGPPRGANVTNPSIALLLPHYSSSSSSSSSLSSSISTTRCGGGCTGALVTCRARHHTHGTLLKQPLGAFVRCLHTFRGAGALSCAATVGAAIARHLSPRPR